MGNGNKKTLAFYAFNPLTGVTQVITAPEGYEFKDEDPTTLLDGTVVFAVETK